MTDTWLGTLFETVGPLLTVLVPLVAVPLTIITFYLRSLREDQVTWHEELVRRLDSVESAIREQRAAVRDFERDYTTKEEWLREYLYTRRTLEQLRESTVRLEATLNALTSPSASEPRAEPQACRPPFQGGLQGVCPTKSTACAMPRRATQLRSGARSESNPNGEDT